VARSYVASEGERWDEAVEFGRLAAQLREHLVYEEGRHDLESRLGGLYGSMGVWRESDERLSEAVAFYRRAIEIREARLARGDDVRIGSLAESHLRLASCVSDPALVRASCDRAMELVAEHQPELSEAAEDLIARFGLR
jgi:hypothetical protein